VTFSPDLLTFVDSFYTFYLLHIIVCGKIKIKCSKNNKERSYVRTHFYYKHIVGSRPRSGNVNSTRGVNYNDYISILRSALGGGFNYRFRLYSCLVNKFSRARTSNFFFLFVRKGRGYHFGNRCGTLETLFGNNFWNGFGLTVGGGGTGLLDTWGAFRPPRPHLLSGIDVERRREIVSTHYDLGECNSTLFLSQTQCHFQATLSCRNSVLLEVYFYRLFIYEVILKSMVEISKICLRFPKTDLILYKLFVHIVKSSCRYPNVAMISFLGISRNNDKI
jgi:hypothetical protein